MSFTRSLGRSLFASAPRALPVTSASFLARPSNLALLQRHLTTEARAKIDDVGLTLLLHYATELTKTSTGRRQEPSSPVHEGNARLAPVRILSRCVPDLGGAGSCTGENRGLQLLGGPGAAGGH